MLTAAVTNGFVPAETMALFNVTSVISVITETSRVSTDLKPSSFACSHKREAGKIALQVKSLLCEPGGQHSGPQNPWKSWVHMAPHLSSRLGEWKQDPRN